MNLPYNYTGYDLSTVPDMSVPHVVGESSGMSYIMPLHVLYILDCLLQCASSSPLLSFSSSTPQNTLTGSLIQAAPTALLVTSSSHGGNAGTTAEVAAM